MESRAFLDYDAACDFADDYDGAIVTPVGVVFVVTYDPTVTSQSPTVQDEPQNDSGGVE